MRIIALGDIMGKAGRRCLHFFKDRLHEQFSPDVVIANGENAAGGFGLTTKVYKELTDKYGIDCLTMGNHWHDKNDIYNLIATKAALVLPANMYNVKNPDYGLRIMRNQNGLAFAVMNVIGTAFMKGENRCPFKAIDYLLEKIPPSVKVRILDIHAEATSEKQAIAHYVAGRVSLVYGTHTHCPTGDERIIANNTGFTSDIGMTGGYDSIIGVRKDAALRKFLTGEKKRFEPATNDPWLCGLIVDIDDVTGYCVHIQRIRWELHRYTEDHPHTGDQSNHSLATHGGRPYENHIQS